jgi:phage replication-related protein YjqB (UPF0714/DUF867 family)
MDRCLNFPIFANSVFTGQRGVISKYEKKQRNSRAAIIAPHGGTIEAVTSKLAEAAAGASFSWYCFEGLDENWGSLHITSSNFDEPQCLTLIASCDIVVAIHGRKDAGDPATIFVGGLDKVRQVVVCLELKSEGFLASTASTKFSGRDRSNICNRGLQRMGVQLDCLAACVTGSTLTTIYSTIS